MIKRRWFQIHLSTAMVLMLVASAFITAIQIAKKKLKLTRYPRAEHVVQPLEWDTSVPAQQTVKQSYERKSAGIQVLHVALPIVVATSSLSIG